MKCRLKICGQTRNSWETRTILSIAWHFYGKSWKVTYTSVKKRPASNWLTLTSDVDKNVTDATSTIQKYSKFQSLNILAQIYYLHLFTPFDHVLMLCKKGWIWQAIRDTSDVDNQRKVTKRDTQPQSFIITFFDREPILRLG